MKQLLRVSQKSGEQLLHSLKEKPRVSEMCTILGNAYAPPTSLLTSVGSSFRALGQRYLSFSIHRPYQCASLTGLTVLTVADVSSQYLTEYFVWRKCIGTAIDSQQHNGIFQNRQKCFNFKWDRRRTLALATFGFSYYGFVCKKIYFVYDAFFNRLQRRLRRESLLNLVPKKPWKPLTVASLKTVFDCGVHTPIVLLPSFYLITGVVKGQSLAAICQQLRREWLPSSVATFFYWLPLMLFSFAVLPIESRILFITVASFFHKLALSWYSNRGRHHSLATADGKTEEANTAENKDVLLLLESESGRMFSLDVNNSPAVIGST